MASLVIAHGHTDVERELSDSKRVVSKKRTKMLLDNIIGNRATQLDYMIQKLKMLQNYLSLDGCSLLFGKSSTLGGVAWMSVGRRSPRKKYNIQILIN